MLEFFSTDLRQLDPDVADLIGYEAERQARKIILIPSESQAPEAVREALGSVFQNIYAEGYPNPDTHGISETDILDYETQLARYRRFADASPCARAWSTPTLWRRWPAAAWPSPLRPTACRRNKSGPTPSRSPGRPPTVPSTPHW